ncbi:MAG: EAL domain-containing protein [Gammaproteobacteria bacterium]
MPVFVVRRVWRQLTEPGPRAGSGEQRRRHRLLASLLLVIVVLGAASAGVQLALVTDFAPTFTTILVALAALLLAYGLLRRGYYLPAALLTIAVTTAVPLLNLLINPADLVAEAYLIVPALLTVTLLPERAVAPALAVIVAAALIAAMVVGGGTVPERELGALFLLALTSLLLLVVLRHRGRLEQDRRAALAESEANFRALAENANDGILVVQDGNVVFANRRAGDLVGVDAGSLIGQPFTDYVHPDCRAAVAERYQRRMAGKSVGDHYELSLMGPGEQRVPVDINAGRTTWRGRPAGLAAVRDIRERLAAEAETRKLSSALQQTADAVVITDRRGVIEYVNPAFERITGYSREAALGRRPSLLKSGKQGEHFYRNLWETITGGGVFSEVFVNRRKDGSFYYEEKTITPLKDADGHITHFIATGKDISERMRAHERLQFMAHHDALTQLPNRALFMDRLKQALGRARWHGRLVAVMFMDLDRFKVINDSHGHDTGDRLLQELSGRLRHTLRERDTVARFGGDEFAILLDDVAAAGDVAELAEKLLRAFAEPVAVNGREVFTTASIGISMFPADGEATGTLLKHADVAMYRAKELGKNTFQFYSKDMSARAFERLTLETSLRRALERDEFRLLYQPQMDLDSGRLLGFEALLRWQHPDLGLVNPGDIIPVLEETGLVVPVGEWVLRTACVQARVWSGDDDGRRWVSVNVTGRELNAAGFVDRVEQAVAEAGLTTGALQLEITESALMHNTERIQATLETLKALGVRLAIDDFGTGYSSLVYLKRFPIHVLKIDGAFVHSVPGSPDDTAIVRSIVALGRSFGLSVIAEGVETERQLDFLREQGCEAVQGFLLAPPLPAEALPEFVHDFERRRRQA